MKTTFFEQHNGPILFGHRGCSAAAPENTLAAFQHARNMKIPGIELDVRLCATGEMVVFHDDNFTRIFGQEGSIEETAFKDLRRLDAGSHKSEQFQGEKIPLLTEVFDLLGRDTIIDIELKNSSKKTGPQEAELFRLLKEFRREETSLISSFNPLAVKAFRKLAPGIPSAVIYSSDEGVPWYLRRGEGRLIAGCPLLKPDHKLISLKYMKTYSLKKGYPILPWTVDDPRRAQELLEMGVQGIISNQPENLKHLFTHP